MQAQLDANKAVPEGDEDANDAEKEPAATSAGGHGHGHGH